MLTITVGVEAIFDDEESKFGNQGGYEVQLEHSLVSLSKWESEFEKPFLGKEDRTTEEALAYIRCMVVGPNPPGDFLDKLSKENLDEIYVYIERKMTATWFSEVTPQPKRSSETITSELVYYWMTVFNIPFECETWHLNRLFTLIRVCNTKNDNKPKKMSRADIIARNRKLNAERREQLKTRG